MIELKLASGIHIKVKQIPNVLVYTNVLRFGLEVPEPPIVELEDGRETVNTFSPTYQDAVVVYQLQQNNYAFDVILENAVIVDDFQYSNPEWKETYLHLRRQRFFSIPDSEKVCFLRYFAVGDNHFDKHNITRNAILHEGVVQDIFKSVLITRDGYDIKEANIKNSLHVGIEAQPLIVEGCQLVTPIDEYEACKDIHADWIRWINCEYSIDEKASIVGLYRLNRLRQSHIDDVVQIESEKKSKSKGK